MESQVKYHCQLCQEETDHATSHCPKLKCIQCGLQGHTKRDCPLQRGFELKSTIVKEVPNLRFCRLQKLINIVGMNCRCIFCLKQKSKDTCCSG